MAGFELTLRHYTIAGLIFVLLVTGATSIITLVEKGDIGDQENTKVTGFMDNDVLTKFNRSLNVYDNLNSDVISMKESIKLLNPQTPLEVLTLPVAFIQTAWKIIKVAIDGFDFMSGAISGLIGNLGVYVPDWVSKILILITSVFLIYTILSLIMGKDT